MLVPLTLLSVLCLLGWLRFSVTRRGRDVPPRRPVRAGLLERNERGSLLSAAALTLFVAAGWIAFLSHSGSGSATGVSLSVGRVLMVAGGVLLLSFVLLFVAGRPRILVSLSMPPEFGQGPA